MKSQIIPLLEDFLFGNGINKVESFDSIKKYLEIHCSTKKKNFIKNVIKLYGTEFNNFCIEPSCQHKRELIPLITTILSVLNVQEQKVI